VGVELSVVAVADGGSGVAVWVTGAAQAVSNKIKMRQRVKRELVMGSLDTH